MRTKDHLYVIAMCVCVACAGLQLSQSSQFWLNGDCINISLASAGRISSYCV